MYAFFLLLLLVCTWSLVAGVVDEIDGTTEQNICVYPGSSRTHDTNIIMQAYVMCFIHNTGDVRSRH